MSQDLFPLQHFRQQMIHLQSSDLCPRLDFADKWTYKAKLHILIMISDYLWQVPEGVCLFYSFRIFVWVFMSKIKSCWIERNW